MKYLHLVWASLFRRRSRTALTLVSVVTAFLLYGLLDAVRTSFAQIGQGAQGASRLQTTSRVSFILPLPMALQARIAKVDGVKAVSYANWFASFYQDSRNQIAAFAVAPNYLELFPELEVNDDARKAFADKRIGALVGEGLMAKDRWKIGDRVPLQSTMFLNHQGRRDWIFEIVGVMRASDKSSAGFFNQAFLLQWAYFDETTPDNQSQAGWYVTRVDEPGRADGISRAIDALSANSAHQTRTQTEQAAAASWLKQMADIGLIVGSVMGAVFFTLLLVTGNTMIQAVRERTSELAVLKTIGFSSLNVLAMVLGESVLLLLLGGMIGMGLASIVGPAISAASGGVLSLTAVGIGSWVRGVSLTLAIGILVGALPAMSAMRLNIVEALTRR